MKLRTSVSSKSFQRVSWWGADSNSDLFDSRDQSFSSYARERGHSLTHLGVQEEGLHLLQQLPGPGPLMHLVQAGGGPLQQRLCATPQGGHQHQSQHLPWIETRVTLPPTKLPPSGPSPPPASPPQPAAATCLLRSPTPRVRLEGRAGAWRPKRWIQEPGVWGWGRGQGQVVEVAQEMNSGHGSGSP